MTRRLVIAAGIGAGIGLLLKVGFEFGTGAFFWVADRWSGWREQKREKASN